MTEFTAQIKKIESKNSYGDIVYRIVLEPCYVNDKQSADLHILMTEQVTDECNVKVNIKKEILK